MTLTFQLLLFMIAVVLLALAGFGVTAHRVHLGWLGLAVAGVAAWIIPAV